MPAQGDPAEWPLWTRRTGVSLCFQCRGNAPAQSGRSRLMPKLFAKTCRFMEFQAGSCLYVTVAVKAASHFGTAYVAAAAEACSRLVGVCCELRCTHSTYMFNEACQGFLNEVWVHWFSSLPFGSLFILFPFTHFCSLLFFHVLLSSCLSSHPLVPALACTCTTTCTLNPGFRWPGSL